MFNSVDFFFRMYLLRTSHRSLFCVIIEGMCVVWYVVDAILSGFVVFDTGSVCVALGVLELSVWTRLAFNSETGPLPPKCWD